MLITFVLQIKDTCMKYGTRNTVHILHELFFI